MIPFSSVAVFLKRSQGANWTAREYPMTDSHGDLVVFRLIFNQSRKYIVVWSVYKASYSTEKYVLGEITLHEFIK
jgi:hypothetical protein